MMNSFSGCGQNTQRDRFFCLKVIDARSSGRSVSCCETKIKCDRRMISDMTGGAMSACTAATPRNSIRAGYNRFPL
jgi:hypothetical protein